MAPSERQLLDALSRTPFVDSTKIARILGEPHATIHRTLAGLLTDGIVGRVSHGTAHLPSSQRYHLTAQGVGEAAWMLGFATPSDFVRAYPASKEWLTLFLRRMDAVASVYRLGPVHTNESKWFIIVGWNSQKLNTNASPPICPSNAAT